MDRDFLDAELDFDTEDTDEITCPHCGYEFSESGEFRGDYGDTVCQECGKPFRWERCVYVTYNTEPLDEADTGA